MEIKETIGIDVSKATLDASIHSNKRSATFENTEKGMSLLVKWVLDGSIKAIPAYVVKKSTCSRSRENYLTSPFSKWLDSDVHTIIEEIEGLTFYWTDKPVK